MFSYVYVGVNVCQWHCLFLQLRCSLEISQWKWNSINIQLVKHTEYVREFSWELHWSTGLIAFMESTLQSTRHTLNLKESGYTSRMPLHSVFTQHDISKCSHHFWCLHGNCYCVKSWKRYSHFVTHKNVFVQYAE